MHSFSKDATSPRELWLDTKGGERDHRCIDTAWKHRNDRCWISRNLRRLANRNPSKPLPPASQELTDCTLYAMQFIADVYHLHKGGYISKSVWRVWEREIRKTLTGPVFQREWYGVAAEFAHTQDFVNYINAVMCSGRGVG